MKRIILFFLTLIFLILLLPTLVILCAYHPASNHAGNDNDAPQLTFKNTETNQVETMNLEDYLIGVVAAEMPASFHEEALRAQATAARTYIYNKMIAANPNSDHPEAAVCTDSAHCKAWFSKDTMLEKLGADWQKNYYSKIADSVRDTRGEIITYDNDPIVAVFHSTSSGRTENSKDVWGSDLPYLKSVESTGDTASPKYQSIVEIPKSEICETLKIQDPHVYDCVRTEGGAVDTINIGGFLFRGTDIRAFFSLNSANFSVEETEESFLFHVLGSGHGVGLSQYGANAMAENGYSYKEILSTYYTDTDIVKKW